jgi:hypothetical protein
MIALMTSARCLSYSLGAVVVRWWLFISVDSSWLSHELSKVDVVDFSLTDGSELPAKK